MSDAVAHPTDAPAPPPAAPPGAPRTYELTFACPGCGDHAVSGTLTEATTSMACDEAGHETPLPEAPDTVRNVPAGPCPVCGSADLYQQRDFNKPLGLTLAAIGLLLGPWTSWISVMVAIAIDAVLYLIVKPMVVCYACSAQVRGVPKERLPEPFEIALHDVYKFNRRHPPRREAAVAGPLQLRLQREAS